MTLDKIERDLKDIRYYYSRKKAMDESADFVGKSGVIEKSELYNAIVAGAPPRLYDLYVSLYVGNNTQIGLAEKWGYSEGYIKNLNRRLKEYIKAAFEAKGVKL